MTHTASPIDAATAAVQRLAIELLDDASTRCRRADLDRCDDWEDVVALLDWGARGTYGESLRERIRSLLEQAGIDLPDEASGPHSVIEGMVLHAALAAGDRLGDMRAAAMPASLEEALASAVVSLELQRVIYRFSDLDRMIRNGEAEEDGTITCLTPGVDDRFFTTLFRLGIVVMRDGKVVVPASEEERAQARLILQNHLLRQVCFQLGSYWHPCHGLIEVRDVKLTMEENFMARAAADEIYARTA